MIIRPTKREDAEALAAIRRQDGVRENVLALSSERSNVTRDFIDSLAGGGYGFTAEKDGKVAGIAVILLNKHPRRTHCATIAIMVDTFFQGRGVGTALLKKVTEVADRELGLHRLELSVLADNERAIKLYKKFGFEVEATKKNSCIKAGAFADELYMGRIAPKVNA